MAKKTLSSAQIALIERLQKNPSNYILVSGGVGMYDCNDHRVGDVNANTFNSLTLLGIVREIEGGRFILAHDARLPNLLPKYEGASLNLGADLHRAFVLKSPTELSAMFAAVKENDLESMKPLINYIDALHNNLSNYQIVMDQISFQVNRANVNVHR